MSIRLIHQDIKDHIEAITGLDAYPIFLPVSANLHSGAAVAYRLESAIRGESSNLQSTTTSNHVYTFFIFSRDFGAAIPVTQSLIDSIEGEGYLMGSTNVLMSHVTEIADDYDHEQTTYIQTIQCEFFVSEN